jgi:hypothetical protein
VIYIYYRPYKYLLATILKCIQEFFYFLLACFYLRLITINEDFLSPSKINNNSVKNFYSIGDLINDTSACFIVSNIGYFVFILITTIKNYCDKKENPLYPDKASLKLLPEKNLPKEVKAEKLELMLTYNFDELKPLLR